MIWRPYREATSLRWLKSGAVVDEPPGSGDTRVEEVSLEHNVVLGVDGMTTHGYSLPCDLWMEQA